MQELHDQLANFQVTAADKYDPARVIEELRRFYVELGALGDVDILCCTRIEATARQSMPGTWYRTVPGIWHTV